MSLENYMRKDLKETEDKRTKLYYDYLYIKNAKKENPEHQKKIKRYFDNELHYIGAYDRYNKTFEKQGSPIDWTDKQLEKYEGLKDIQRYEQGIPLFRSSKEEGFFPSVKGSKGIYSVQIAKDVDYPLFDTTEMETQQRNYNFYDDVEKELKRLVTRIFRYDNTKGIRKAKTGSGGFIRFYTINLSDVRLLIWINGGFFKRVISTTFTNANKVVKEQQRRLENYLGNFTSSYAEAKLNEKDLGSTYEEQFEREEITEKLYLEKIEIHKRSNKPFTYDKKSQRISSNEILEIRRLKSYSFV